MKPLSADLIVSRNGLSLGYSEQDTSSVISVANFMLAKEFCMHIMLYSHQKILYLLQKPVPCCNQKVNDYEKSLMKKTLRCPAP